MTPAGADFAAAAEPLRAELLAHCYRLLGSRHDAEDAVQETYLRAWRAYDRFEGRSTLRRWLYAIATRASLTAIEQRSRRAYPLEPLPDSLIGGDDPAAAVAARAGVRLAFVAALQRLPARQRAVLVLRDVLQWPAAEVAQLLDMTGAGVNSALQRARATLARLDLDLDDVAEPADTTVLDRYAAAFEHADVGRLADLVRDDVVLDMPPRARTYHGREAVLGFLAGKVHGRSWRVVATRANGQAAFECHLPEGLHALHVLTFRDGRIGRITVFLQE
ncbi:sigma-70 family RNA polymerase sigma factor [Amorphoplanes nipponensis]|uniref:RNA polymerase sigma factor n=1 Tax=Actinoplanes nipponensis TaxID=135950 RepID=A0A919MUF0_9ACTN|nr:sigma-70 family RNA polymerase sigma factor [Actinoplanes nipponensis]GIE54588.1 RNA polymerase sigma factor [Actinoplanes nipponensis]